ncbi:PqqD family protein [Haloimpatiens sp. FM7330]|uniref:PqqD family protein n=1 Tax=Haloimpatiens sp. FM7330 TaxID=3298610 RepID=UPI003640186C
MFKNEQNDKRDKMKEDNFLLYKPKKKHKEWEIRDGRVYIIFHHDKVIERFMRWLVKKPAVSDIKLDELGTQVWKAIDEKNSVYDIGQILLKHPKLAKEYKEVKIDECGDSCHPIYNRLIMYLRYLNRKGWISFEIGNQEIRGEM